MSRQLEHNRLIRIYLSCLHLGGGIKNSIDVDWFVTVVTAPVHETSSRWKLSLLSSPVFWLLPLPRAHRNSRGLLHAVRRFHKLFSQSNFSLNMGFLCEKHSSKLFQAVPLRSNFLPNIFCIFSSFLHVSQRNLEIQPEIILMDIG